MSRSVRQMRAAPSAVRRFWLTASLAAISACILAACATPPTPYATPTTGLLAKVRYRLVDPIGRADLRVKEGCKPPAFVASLKSGPYPYEKLLGRETEAAGAPSAELHVRAGAAHTFHADLDLSGNRNVRCVVSGSFLPTEGSAYDVDVSFTFEKYRCDVKLFKAAGNGAREQQPFASAPVCPQTR